MRHRGINIPEDDGVIMWMSALLRSPAVKQMITQTLNRPPAGLDVMSLMDLMAAVHQTAAQLEAHAYARDRENAAAVHRLRPDSRWRVEDVMRYTGLRARTVQQRAPEMGGVRCGRRWEFDPDAVRRWQQLRLLQRDAL